MSNESIELEGPDFSRFAKKNAEWVLLCPSMAVVHQTLGLGTVETIVPREGRSPLFCIFFASTEKISKFNLDAFDSGKLSVVGLPPVLTTRFRVWKTDFERIEAERETAVKAARAKAEDEEKKAFGVSQRGRVSRLSIFWFYGGGFALRICFGIYRKARSSEN